MKTQKEISEAIEEFFEHMWYSRQGRLIQSGQVKEDFNEQLPWGLSFNEMKEKYKDDDCTDFEWGVLSGKRTALQWVMDTDSTWDEASICDT